MDLTARPEAGEFGEFHIGYIAAVPDGDVRHTLAAASDSLRSFYSAIPEERADHAYAAGKWTVRELVAHVADSERIFACRALRFGRGDTTPLPGFDQEVHVPNSHAGTRPWRSIVDDLLIVRQSTESLFRSFQPSDFARRGEASGTSVTVRSQLWILLGHELHHRKILRERYGL